VKRAEEVAPPAAAWNPRATIALIAVCALMLCMRVVCLRCLLRCACAAVAAAAAAACDALCFGAKAKARRRTEDRHRGQDSARLDGARKQQGKGAGEHALLHDATRVRTHSGGLCAAPFPSWFGPCGEHCLCSSEPPSPHSQPQPPHRARRQSLEQELIARALHSTPRALLSPPRQVPRAPHSPRSPANCAEPSRDAT
jgi:hypothetical protein